MITQYGRFQDAPPDDHQLQRWASALWPCNLGGVVRAGFLVVECDSASAESECVSLDPRLLALAPCRERRPGRGRAWVLSSGDSGVNRSSVHRGRTAAIDVIAPGSVLVVPPSVHVSGHEVRWVPGREPWQTAPIAINAPLCRLCSTGDRRTRSAQVANVPPVRTGAPSVQVLRCIRTNPRLRELWHGRGKPGGDCSESGYDFSVAKELLRSGVREDEVVAAILHRPRRRERDYAYALLTVQNAGKRR